jgi:hypothetical protein
MDPAAMIESYVEDVARRVPRAERNDVAIELRTLLGEELQARAAAAARAPDEAMAVDLLSRFGRPDEVAELYGPPGLVIIKPAAGRAFAWTALIGVAVQWALTLPAAFARAPSVPGGDPLTLLARWWLTWGVGAFWFPGFMVVGAVFAAWVGERWPRPATWAPRRVIDRDRVNRPLLGLGLVAWAAYMVLLALEPALLTRLPQPVAAAFTFDDGFLAWRGPWLFPIWGAQLVLCAAVLVRGRWRRRTRELNALASAALCALLAWFVAAGPIFRAKPTDDLTKALLCAVVLVTLISLGVTLYRQVGRSGLPRVVASA